MRFESRLARGSALSCRHQRAGGVGGGGPCGAREARVPRARGHLHGSRARGEEGRKERLHETHSFVRSVEGFRRRELFDLSFVCGRRSIGEGGRSDGRLGRSPGLEWAGSGLNSLGLLTSLLLGPPNFVNRRHARDHGGGGSVVDLGRGGRRGQVRGRACAGPKVGEGGRQGVMNAGPPSSHSFCRLVKEGVS
ncbi:hypothetical protein MARPO_0057s0030 [Marchantia polymorpha]|uniref:Uncharacterized protein n=1 Tax=Marchantia polymorpha TaxID=3197 RepID=A0A2R6WU61_MARPO|nr:hypothetical protein MARPO_0057s0030 [Marchantia polymorpha]|eukprot:PTQ37390.1 hypothetical protein MARPO_0057s0030 [Marchantia polymorpha]